MAKSASNLQAIYASLLSKDVSNVDRLKKAKILHVAHTSISSPCDVRNAVVCLSKLSR
jgi:hypothetical protein